jgi:hypothetical protein
LVERLERHQRKLHTRAERDPLGVRLVSAQDVLFPPQCPVCGAPGTRRVAIEKHCRFTVHTGDGPTEEHHVAQLDVILCSACAERHGSERIDRARGTETSISRTIEYSVNPRTDCALGSREPAWHAFRFPSVEYATKFRELNAGPFGGMPSPQTRPGLFIARNTGPCVMPAAAVHASTCFFTQEGHGHRSHMSAFADKIRNHPVLLTLLN